MLAKSIALTITALIACVASAQPAAEESMDRVLQFKYAETAQGLEEITTVIRIMTEVSKASIDHPQRMLKLRGTAAQLALAEWLLNELDKPSSKERSEDSAVREYRLPGAAEDVLRVFYLAHAETQIGRASCRERV